MDTLQTIICRRSIRRYEQKPVSKEMVIEVLKYAMYAPSANNRQPWSFVVINERSLLNKIMEFHPYSKMLNEAPVAILVCGDELKSHGPSYWIVDCAAATQNILLAAHDLGLGSCWLGIYPREERMKDMREIVDLPGQIQPFALVALGYPISVSPVPERFDEQKIQWNTWKS